MNILKTSGLAFLMMATTVASFAQTAEEIVKKHLDAIGGEAAWKKVNAIKYTGVVSVQGMEIPVIRTIENGKGMRMDLTIMGTQNYMIVTTTDGWVFFPVRQQQKPEPLTADQVKQAQSEIDAQGELVDYKAKGNKIEFLGKDDVEGTAVLKLKLTNKDGEEKTLYFDASNYYLIREVEKVKADGKEMDATTNYGNYQKLPEGITVAMSVESSDGPVTFKSIEINPKVDDSIFKIAN